MVVSLIEINDRAAESVEQDQTARTCSLILLYTLRKISTCLCIAGLVLYGAKQQQDIDKKHLNHKAFYLHSCFC